MQDTLARARPLGLKQPLGQARVTIGYLILVYNKDAYMKKFQNADLDFLVISVSDESKGSDNYHQLFTK